jgi:hypothetical protein
MRSFYERFYALWRELAEYIIRRGEFLGIVTYTPAWTATSGTAPAIGDGTLTGQYMRRDGLCKVWINLTGGSTTSWGSAGFWEFSVPIGAELANAGPAYILDSGTSHYVGIAFISTSDTKLRIVTDASGLPLTFNSPMTWATGDQLVLEMEFRT